MKLTPEQSIARFARAIECAGGTHTVEDVLALIEAGDAQCWNNGDGTIITEIHKFPRLKAVHYWLISGELRSCLALEHDINPWAVEQGCTVATACGRPGWGRVAAPTGWRPWWPNFFKPLVNSDTYGKGLR